MALGSKREKLSVLLTSVLPVIVNADAEDS